MIVYRLSITCGTREFPDGTIKITDKMTALLNFSKISFGERTTRLQPKKQLPVLNRFPFTGGNT